MEGNLTLCDEDHADRNVLEILVFSSIMFLVISGNILVLLSFIFCEKLHQQISNYLILNLAITDFVLGIFILPFELLQLVFDGWILGEVFCSIWLTSQLFLCLVSIFSLLLISSDKYANITRPLQYSHKVTTRRIVVAVLTMWVLAALLSWIPAVCGHVSALYVDDCDNFSCQTHWSVGMIWYAATVGFIIPFTILFYTNVRIYRIARRQSRQISVHTRSMGPRRPPARAVMATVFLVLTFTAMWMPYFITNMIYAYYPDCMSLKTLTNYCSWLGYANSAVNPFLYTYNKDFKNAYCKFVPCARKRNTSAKSLSSVVRQDHRVATISLENLEN